MSLPTPPPCAATEIRASRLTGDCAVALRPWILATCICGSSLAFLIGGGVNVALPAVQQGLDASVPGLQWILNGYMLTLAAFTLPMGAAGDRFGRGVLFRIGIATFAVGSLGCAIAPGVASLVAGRLLQGLGAAMLVPNSLAILAAAYPPAERGAAIGTWASASALTSALGPAAAGVLTETLGWRSVFAVFVPLSVAVLLLALKVLPISRDENAGRVDLIGTALATVGLGILTYALIQAGDAGWGTPTVMLPLLTGLAVCVAFVRVEYVREQRGDFVLMPPSLFADRTFAGTNLLTLSLYFATMGAFFFIPFNLTQVRGLAAWQVGLGFLPFSLAMAVLGRASGRLADRIGPRTQLISGPLITAAAFVCLLLPGENGGYWTAVFPGMMLLGIGMAATSSPLTTAVMNSVPANRTGAASGVNNMIARVASLLAVAVLGGVLVGVFRFDLETMTSGLPEPGMSITTYNAMVDPDPFAIAADLPPAIRRLRVTAFLSGYRTVMLISLAATLLAAAAAAVVIPRSGAAAPARS